MPLTLQCFSNLSDANAALKKDGARYLGGGTLTVREINEGGLSFNALVRSTDERLSIVQAGKDNVTIGASVTMARVAQYPGLEFLAKAARAVGGPAIRNMATVGGNLFASAPYGDFSVALLALDAVVCFDKREIPIDQFMSQRSTIRDIVTAVRFKPPPPDSFRFVKVSRVKPKGVAVLSIAAVIELSASAIVEKASIALGCMNEHPVRANQAEQALVGSTLSEAGIAAAAAVVGAGTKPLTDPVASSWYRGEVLPVHFRRLLLGWVKA